MKKGFVLFLTELIFCLFAQLSVAQIEQDTIKYRIETTDGNEYIGTIRERDSEKIKLKTENLGEITIPFKDVESMVQIEVHKMIKGKYWFKNPQSTRYFWIPNGYGLEKGESYYQNVWIFFNQFATGLTDNFSIGGGLMPNFLLGGAATPVWITPKFSIPIEKEKFNIGGGALIGTVLGEEDSNYGIVYGLTTFGSRDKNLSFGIGYGYADDDWARYPVINFSAMIRTGPRGYFLTENYYFPGREEDVVLLSLGGRQIIKRLGLDYGLYIPFYSDMDTFVAVPWLGITVPFKNKKKNKLKNKVY